jgi:hypothetical protein
MILNGNDVWFIPPTSRYALSKVSCKEVTTADFTFLCRVRVDWDKMKENSVTEESAVMIKNGKHLGISVLKTGDDFRVAKATVWTGNIKPSTIPDRQIQQWIHGSPDETNNEDEIHQILIPLNDIENSADISNGDLDFIFSYSVSEKKLRFIPIILFLFSNIIWGFYSYSKTDYFAFGIKSTSFNAITMASAYHKEFNLIYPRISPDRIFEKFEDEIIKQGFKNEWQVDQFMMKKNINFFLENPKEVFIGILKKINIILFYPFKDSQQYNADGSVTNDLRLSNFVNKPIFILSLFTVFIFNDENVSLLISFVSPFFTSLIFINFNFGSHVNV